MLRSLNSAISGLQQFQNELDVIGNNIANANTTGFKSARTNFKDAFSQTLQVAGGGSPSSTQIGSGVATASIANVFTQGALTTTGRGTDLAVNGEGFFVLSDAATGENFVTRAGDFSLDSDGYLVTSNGLRVQGFSDGGLSARGDLRVDATGAPGTAASDAKFDSFSIDKNGNINVRLTDGTTFVRGQVLLQSLTNPQALLKCGDNLYSGINLAGPLGGAGTPQAASPGQFGTGYIQAGALELSNVDLTREFSSLITTQRAFQANARVITTSDEVLQELVSLKR
jgi:flagellar hook protein FlgE